MDNHSTTVNKNYRISVLKAFFNIFTISFLCLSLFSLWSTFSEKKEWSYAKKTELVLQLQLLM